MSNNIEKQALLKFFSFLLMHFKSGFMSFLCSSLSETAFNSKIVDTLF